YQHNHEFLLHFPSESYAIFEEKLVMISACATDVSVPVCFIESNYYDEHFINKEEIICERGTDQFLGKLHRISIRKLLDFIDNDDQEKKIVRGEELSEFTLPCIDLYDARITQVQEEETDVKGCSKIGRVLRERVGNLWQDKLEIFI
ncbi:unnamed protein product, partial [Oikopleura dioica]